MKQCSKCSEWKELENFHPHKTTRDGYRPECLCHHDNYDKPLDVRWFCMWCHKGLHGTLAKETIERLKGEGR